MSSPLIFSTSIPLFESTPSSELTNTKYFPLSSSIAVLGISIPLSLCSRYITADTLNPGTIYGIASSGFTSTSKTFSDVVSETFDILDIFVTTPGYDFFFSNTSGFIINFCPSSISFTSYSGTSKTILISDKSAISIRGESVSTR